ncbi:MAG: hypothetical protein K2W92_04215, partial [Alphaproteobacteria bacterium]|nr:hypothetical protein [Alphaproteobacteria bacterium]
MKIISLSLLHMLENSVTCILKKFLLPKRFFPLIFGSPHVEVLIFMEKNKMKSVALTLAVL